MTKKSDKEKNFLVGRTLHYFWSVQWKHKFLTLATFITTPIVTLWREVFSVYILADIVTKITSNPSQEEVMGSLLPEAILFVVLRILFSTLIGEFRIYCHWKMEIHAIYNLSNLCFDTIAAQSMQFHNDRFSGSLVSQVNKFVSGYERFMDVLIWDVIPFLISVIASLVILFVQIPVFALGLLIFIIAYGIIAFIAFKKITPLNLKLASSENKRTGQLADSITNIISVKSYAKEKYEHRRFKKFNANVMERTNNLLRAELKRNFGFDAVYIGISMIILVFLLFGQGWLGVPLGTLILAYQYTMNISDRLWGLNSIFKNMNRIFGDAKEMTEILDMEDDVVDIDNARALKIAQAKIDFSDVTFKHAGAKTPILENFSLEVDSGERIGLVGVSGSGKTTITKLLLRFADVQKGEITIDGQDVKLITQESLRENIAYVPQETSLFHRSIAENIAYAKPTATKEEIERASKLANAHDFIKDLPDGYDTLVGERGVKLSGGQRQRIAIARAILKDAPILVLDEATSALDSESEALIQDALEKLMKNRTSIVIAHRLSTVADLDRIVVLDNGKIIEQGSHKSLLKKSGTYAKLWNRQSGGFIEEE